MRIIPATLAVFVLACTSAPLTYAADLSFHKTLTASGPVALNVCSNSGLIHVTGVSGNTIQVSATIHKGNWHAIGNADTMKKIAAAPPVQQTGNAVKVGDNSTCGAGLLQNVDIDYEISVPRDSTVVARGTGAIHVESINGFVRVHTGNGDITVNGIGAESMLSTGSGNLDIQGAHGMLLAKTGSGSLNIHDSDISSDSQLRVGSGNITATNVKGGMRVSTGNGNISMAGIPTSDWMMRTGNGTIHFAADGNAKFELDAETGSGTIDSSLPAPLSGHFTDGVLRGPVHGGGSVVKIYTGYGNITLQ